MKKRLIWWAIFVVISSATALGLANFQAIEDWWVLHTYTPPAKVEGLAHLARLSSRGKDIFYVSRPQVVEKTDFNELCSFSEYSIVVGCYNGNNIYILDITNEELEAAEIVTAAHEMLHAVYARLPDGDREKIDELLLGEIENITDTTVLNTIKLYRNKTGVDFNNELHSVVGTEVANLDPELEEHFKKYFEERDFIVATAQEYNEIFAELEREATALAERVNGLVDELTAESIRLEREFNWLDATRQALQERVDGGENSASLYEAVANFKDDVAGYNQAVEDYRTSIKQLTSLRAKYDKIALRHEELIKSLDSSSEIEEIPE